MTGNREDQLLRDVLAHEADRHDASRATTRPTSWRGRGPGAGGGARSSAAPRSP